MNHKFYEIVPFVQCFAVFNDNLVTYWCFTNPILSFLCFSYDCLPTKMD